jgi:hypothetical protein
MNRVIWARHMKLLPWYFSPQYAANTSRCTFATVLAANVSETKKQTKLKACRKRRLMSRNLDTASNWFEAFCPTRYNGWTMVTE